MVFVSGHPRALGWVKAHRRRPNRAESGQLPLIVVLPSSRRAPRRLEGGASAAGGAQPDAESVGRSPPCGPLSSARKSAIT